MSRQHNRTYGHSGPGYNRPVTDPDPDAPDEWPPEDSKSAPQTSLYHRSVSSNSASNYQHTQGGPANTVNTLNSPPNHGDSHLSSQNAPYTQSTTSTYQSDRGQLNYVHTAQPQSTSNYQIQQPRTGIYTSQPPNAPSYSTQNDRVAHCGSSVSIPVSLRSSQEPSGSLSQATDWSQWIWDGIYGRYYRYRRNAHGVIEYDYPLPGAA